MSTEPLYVNGKFCGIADSIEQEMHRAHVAYLQAETAYERYIALTDFAELQVTPEGQKAADRMVVEWGGTLPLPATERAGMLPPFDPTHSKIGDIFATMPPEPRFVVAGYLPAACGQENAIGGAGKTTRQMVEHINIILGRPLWGQHAVLNPGPIVVLTKEDGKDIYRYRLRQVADAMNLSGADQRRVMEHYHVEDLSGEVGSRLVEVDRNGNLQATGLAERIYAGYRQEGVALVGFDPWNLFSPGERFVNDAEAALMAAGSLISRELHCCVRYTGHVSKAVGRQGIIDAHSGRGGAAMGDNARFVTSYVQHDPRADKEWAPPQGSETTAAAGSLYRLHITKQSYARRPLLPLWIERQNWGFVVHEGPTATAEDTQIAAGKRVKSFVQQELDAGTTYMETPLIEQHKRYGMSRDEARAAIAWLTASENGLTETPLPEDKRQGRRQNYLKPVWPELPERAEDLF